MAGEGPLPRSKMAGFSLCPHLATGWTEFSGVSFIRGPDPIYENTTLMT